MLSPLFLVYYLKAKKPYFLSLAAAITGLPYLIPVRIDPTPPWVINKLHSFISLSNSSSSSLELSSSSSLSSSKNSSIESTNSSSSLTQSITIAHIKEKAKEYKGLENSVGVYESNYSVEIELKLLACLDAITTKTGYGDRYKILMSDGTDYIYLKTKQENY